MDEIEKKMIVIADLVKNIQDKNESLEKKYDGVIVDEMKKMEGLLIEATKEVEEIKKKDADQKARVDALEKALARNSAPESKNDFNEYEKEFQKFLRKGDSIDPVVMDSEFKKHLMTKGLDEESIKTMQVGVNPQGGYWIQPTRLTRTVTRNFETSPMRDLAFIATTASDSVEMIIDDDEPETESNTEISTRSVTGTPDIGLLQIYTHEETALPKITQKLLDDAGFDVGAWLQNKINRKITRVENTRFILGSGSNQAKGILAYTAWASAGVYQRDAVEQVNSGHATLLTGDGLINLQIALQEAYQTNANWLMRRTSWGAIAKLKDSEGRYLLDFDLLRNGTGAMTLLGKPVKIMSDMPAIGAGALSVAYGDFGEGYTIVDKPGVQILRDPYTDKGRVIFYTSKRVGGAVTNYESFKIQKVSA